MNEYGLQSQSSDMFPNVVCIHVATFVHSIGNIEFYGYFHINNTQVNRSMLRAENGASFEQTHHTVKNKFLNRFSASLMYSRV